MSDEHTGATAEMAELPEPKMIKSNIFPKEAVEGVIAEMINQIKASMDVIVFHSDDLKISKTKSAKATYQIVGEEVQAVLDMLRDYSNAALTPKHRMCRAIMREFMGRLENIEVMDAKAQHSKHLTQFATELVEFLTTLHEVLKTVSKPEKRQAYTMEYCGFVPGATGGLN